MFKRNKIVAFRSVLNKHAEFRNQTVDDRRPILHLDLHVKRNCCLNEYTENMENFQDLTEKPFKMRKKCTALIYLLDN